MSETFTQSILVCDEAKENQKAENYRNLGTYRELFYRKNVLQKRVILLGEAGAGKTTFSKHLTDVWCKSTTLPQFADVAVLKEFDYLFYVSCKFSNKEESILDMITNQLFDEERMRQVALYVLKNHPESCLILIDGADEWEGSPTSETGRRGDIAGLPSVTGVDGSVILITSRPWRFYALSKKTQNVFMRLKINGIKDIEELTKRILQQLDDPDPDQSSSKFLRQVSEKNMSELMKIPLILIITLGSWVDGDSLHKSMCINYIYIIQSFIRRSKGQSNWQSSEGKLQRVIPSLHGLEAKWEKQSNELPDLLTKYKTLQRYAGLFLSLGHQAFDLLFRENEQSLVFSKAVCKSYLGANEENDESINVCLALGILSKTESTTRGLKKIESYAFCHKTFQEFFAALWLASNYANKKSKLYKCIKNYDDLFDYEMLIKFLCGIDPMAGKQMWLDLAEDVENRVGKIEMIEMMQTLVCECMKQHALDPMDQASDQIYFCIPHIRIIVNYDSDENIMLLCHVLEEYSCNVKSVRIGSLNAEVQSLKLYGISPPALDLRKYIKLKKLVLENLSVEGLVLPVEGTRFTLKLYNVTMTHHDLEQLSEYFSSCSDLEKLSLVAVRCNEQSHSCCIPVLDLQKHKKLKKLELANSSFKGLLLPVEGTRIKSLELTKVTMTHHDLEQLSEYFSSCSDLEKLSLVAVRCDKQSHSCCIPVLDLQKHKKLKELKLENLSVGGLLLPVEGVRMTLLVLNNVTMTHHDLEQLSGLLSSYSDLEELALVAVICNEQSHNCCIPVLDLHKHNKLEILRLENLSVEGLLLTAEGVRMTFLRLSNVTMAHQDLEQLSGLLSFYSDLESLYLDAVICNEQSHSCCIPVLDLQKHNKLKILWLENLSVGGLLLPVEGTRMTHLYLDNVTMSHHDLEQLSGSLSSYSDLEVLSLDAVICNEQSHSCCIPVLDLKKHNKLKILWLENLSVGGLLLPVEGTRMTHLYLDNVTMSHHDLEQLSGSLSSFSDLEELSLDAVICNEQSHNCCIPVLDLQKHNKLKKLMLKNLSFGALLLPVEGVRMTLLELTNVTMSHHHDLEQMSGSLSSYSDLEKLDLVAVICNEQSHSCCIPVLDLQKHNKLKKLMLKNLSVGGLLLPVEGVRMTFLELTNVTMSHHHDLEQLSGSLSSYSDLEKLDLVAVICNEQSHSCCIPVLDLQKHNKLKKLWLKNLSVGGLLLPVEGVRMTFLMLSNVTMAHQDLEQLSGLLSSYSDLESLYLDAVICNEQSHMCFIPVLDLQKHNKLKKLWLKNLSVGALLLPVEGTRMAHLYLDNVTMSHHDLEQLSGSLSSYSDLEELSLDAVICNEQSHSCCVPVLDLQKHSNLKELRLKNLSVGGLLLPVEGVRMTLLVLNNVTMSHHHDLEQLSGSLSSCSDLEKLDLDAVICNEQSHSSCIPVLDLQKHNTLMTLMLKNLSVGGLLLPVEGVRMTSLMLNNVTMAHHDLEQLSGFLSSYSDLEELDLDAVICNEQSPNCCIPVLDLQKHNKLKKLMLKNLSVGALLLPVEGVRMTLLLLNNVTMSHHHDLEQLSGSLSSYSDIEKLDLVAVICNEQSHSCCIPVLDLQKHNKLKKLWLKNLSVGGLLLPVEGTRMTHLYLDNVTMSHHDLEQLSGSLSSYSDLEKLVLVAVICNDQSHNCCIPVLDLQKHNKLEILRLENLSVEGLLLTAEGVRMTFLMLSNVTMAHHDLEQLSGLLSSYSDLEALYLDAVICNEQSHSCCIPVLDLQKHNKLKKLRLKNLSVGSLLLPVEGVRMTLLVLDNITMSHHHDLEQLSGSLSSFSDLEELSLGAVICNEQSHNCCIPVLDLQKHNKLKKLMLKNLSVGALLLPVEGVRMTLLELTNVTMSHHHDLEQLSGSLSSYSDIEKLDLVAVICNEQSHSCCIPVLDLQKHNKLKKLWLKNLSVRGLLLPVEGTRMTHLYLDNVTMSHYDLEQLSGSLSSFSDLEKLDLDAVICNEQSHNCCIPVLDLQKHNTLMTLMLKNLSVGGLLLPVEGVRMTLLELTNVTMSHQHDLEQLSGSLSSYSDLEKLDLVAVICNEQNHSCCIPVLDLQKHKKLKKLWLKNLSVGGLLLPVEGTRMAHLYLDNVTMSHHDLEQLSGSLSSYSDLEKLVLVAVICNEQSHNCCIPVLDLQKHNKLEILRLENLSVEGLLLNAEGVRMTFLRLSNVTMAHQDLEQLSGLLSFYSDLESLSLDAVICNEQSHSCCIPVLDLKKHNKLKILWLENVSVGGLLLPVEGTRMTHLYLDNVTMSHHDLEQLSGSLSSFSDLEELSLDAVICNEQSHNCCIPVLDLQKLNKLKKLMLKNLSVGALLLPVEGTRMTHLYLDNVTMSHHHDLEQLSGSLSSYSDLEELSLDAVICNEQSHNCCIPVLDLQKHNKLKKLMLKNLSVGALLLPVEGVRMTLLELTNVTMSHHHDLEQLSGSLSSYSDIEKLDLVAVICNEQSHSCCIPVLDLQKHNKLKKLMLKNLSVGALLLPVEGVRMTLLELTNVTMSHHHDLEQLSGSLSSYSDIEKLDLVAVICNEQSHSCCIPVLDLQKHNKLKKLWLKNLSVRGLLLPVEGTRMTHLYLDNVTMSHHDLEQLSGSLSSFSDLEKLDLDAVICNEQSHNCCIPVLDLQKHNTLMTLMLKNLSVGGLLLPVEGVRMTLLELTNVTMSHQHDLEQLSGSLSSYSDLEKLDLVAVICNEQNHSCCIPVLDLQKHKKLKKLWLKNLSVGGLLLPVEGTRMAHLYLDNVTMSHHDLEQLSGSLSSYSDLEKLVLVAVICNEQSHNCCIPVLDLQKHNKLEILRLENLSVEGLLLNAEGVRMTFLRLSNVTMAHQDLEQLSGLLSFYSDLESLSLDAVICNEQSHSCCIPVLDLKKHNKLKILWLENVSVGGLLLPVEGTRMTHLYLDNVTMSHHDLEQLSGSLSSFSDLEELSLDAVICNEQSHNCCIPVLDLQKLNKLKKLMLKNLSVGALLLPVEGVRMTLLELTNVTMSHHHDLEQLSGSLSSYSDLEKLDLVAVICNEQSHSCCIPVLDLQKHNKLKKLWLKNLSVGGLLLPVEGVRMTFLMLSNVTMAHQDLEQLSGLLSSYSDLESLYLDAVICNEQSHSCCIPVLDLQKHNKLKKLWLKNLSVGGLLLPVEGVRMTLLVFYNVTMSHHDLEQLSGSLSSFSDLEELSLDAVICNEQSHNCCIPVLDLQKHNKLKKLMLKNLSVGALLLPVEGVRMTLLELTNVTMSHQHDLEQLSGSLSSYSDIEKLDLVAVICNEQSHSCCIPVLDLQKHNKLKKLWLKNLSVGGLLLPVEGTRMAHLYLDNVTMSHHDLEQLSGSLSSYSDLEELSLDAVICNEQSHSCCVPVLDLQKHSNLKELRLKNLSVGGLLLPVEGVRMTLLVLNNVTMSHHHDLEQLSGSLSSCSDLEKLDLDAVICNEQSHSSCIPVLDLQKHNTLMTLMLKNLSVGGLLLPVEGVRMTSLMLNNVTMAHHDLEQLSGFLSSYSDLEELDLDAVICNEQSPNCCIPVLDLQKHNKLKKLMLKNLSVGALLLPVEGVRMTLLLLNNVTMSHHHDLEQLSGSLSSYSDIEKLDLVAVICNEQSHSCCIPVLDLQKHNKLKKLWLKNLSVGGLLLPVEGTRMTHLYLDNVTMSHHDLEQLSGSLSSYSDLEKLVLVAVICNDQSHNCCIPVLDLQKHNKLEILRLENLSVEGLLLTAEGVRMTFLMLSNVTMAHHDLEQLSGLLSSYSDLEALYLDAVICNEQSHSCCIPVLDLQKHNKLKKLRLKNLSVGSLLLPVEGVRMTLLVLDNITMSHHHDLEQLSGSLSSFSDLEELSLGAVICNEQSHNCCIPVLDLQKHNKLKKLMLKNLSVGALLLPVEGVRMTLLELTNVTMSHHHDLEQLSGSLSSYSDIEKLDLVAVICNEQSHSCCIPVLDLQKHNKLKKLWLKNLSVRGLLLPVEGTRMTHLYLDNVTMSHYDLEQLSGSLSSFSDLEKLDLDAVICNEQSHNCCIPVLDLQKHNTLMTLMLKNLSVGGLLLPVEGVRMTLLELTNVTMSHQHDLEQLSGSLSSYSDLEKLDLVAVICNEQNHSCCIPVLDLQKHKKLKKLWLKNLSVGGLLLPVEGTRMAHLYLDNVTMSHHDLEQLSGSLSSYSDLEKLVLVAVICNEQSHNCCIPVLDLQKHNKLEILRLENLSVEGLLLNAEGVRMTFLRLSNVTMAHQDLEQLSGLLSFYSDLESLSLDAVICNEQSHSCCIPVLDLKKHNKLKILWLENVSVGGLLLPVEGTRMTHLYLDNVTMSHHDLEQLSGSLSSFSDLEELSLDAVICNEQSHNCCIPVLDLQKLNKLKKLMLKNLSVGALLLPVEGVRMTLLELTNVTMSHHHDLEQLSGSLSSYSDIEKLDLVAVICNEQSHSCCIPVLDLQKHNKLKKLMLKNLSVGALLLPVEGVRMTLLELTNVTMSHHHDLEQLSGSLSSYSDIEKLDLVAVICNEQSHSCCIPVLDLQKHNKLKKLWLKNLSVRGLLLPVEGTRMTHLYLDNVTMSHHDLEQLSGSLSSFSDLEKLDLDAVICNEQSHNCCIPVLDLQKHNTLMTLMLKNLSVGGLLLPVEGVRMTLLELTNVTMSHQHDLEQLSGSLSSYSDLEKLDLVAVICNEQNHSCCIPVLDLQKHKKLKKLWLKNLSVGGLLLPVEGTRMAHLYLDNVTMSHHDLEQLSGSLSSYSDLEKLVLVAVICNEQSHNCCIPVLDLQKHNKLEILRLENLSVEGLLLNAEGVRMTFLRLSNVTMAHQDLEQLSGLLSFYSDLESLSLDAVICNEQSHSCCIPVLDLKKHNKLKILWLENVSVGGLLLPVEGTRMTHLYLDNVTMSHHDLEQLSGSLSSFSDLEELSLDAVICNEQSHNCCIPVLDLQKLNKLKKLMLKNLSVGALLLPVEGVRMTLLELTNVTMSHHHDLEQLSGSLSSYSDLEKLDLVAVICNEQSHSCCIPVLDLQKHNKLKKLWLKNLSVGGLLLPVEGVRMTFLMLSNVTMAHQDLEQLSGLLSSYSDLESLYLDAVICNEQSHSCCIPVLDLQKHNKLKKLWLKNLSVGGLLLPVEGVRMTLLVFYNVTMSHHDLEQLSGSLSSFSDLEELSLDAVICNEQSHNCCIPVLDLQKHNKLKKLMLKNLSVGALLLPVEGVRMTLLELTNVTMSHQHDLEQLSGSLSSYSDIEKLDLVAVICNEQSHSCCIPVLDLQKHNKLKKLWLKNLSVGGLLLPVERTRMTHLYLDNVTMSHHDLEQLSGSLSSYSDLEKLVLVAVICNEQSHNCCIPVLDLQKHNKLEILRLENVSVEGLLLTAEGVRMTFLMLSNVTMAHQDLEQLSGLLSSYSDLESLYLDAVICNEQSHSCCIPVLDLQKHNKLKKLMLKNLSVGALLLPVEGVRMTLLELTNVTMSHQHDLEQLSGSLSSYSDIEKLDLVAVICNEQSHSCCIPVLDLQKHNKLKKLWLKNLSVGGLLLPVEGTRMTHLYLDNVTMSHHDLEQLSGSLSSYSDLEKLVLVAVICNEQSHNCCIPVLDLQKHNKLEILRLENVSVEGLLLTAEGVRMTFLMLSNVTMAHQDLEQLSGLLSSYSDLESLYLDAVICNEQSHSCCIPVLDLQKHNKLKKLWLKNLSVGGLLLPVEGVRMTLLVLNNVTMSHHHDLEQLSGSLSSCSDLEKLDLDAVICNEQSHSCCIPVLDLQKHNTLMTLMLKNLSLGGLLLPVEGVRMTSLMLNNVTMAHHDLEQLSGFLSSYSDLEELDIDAVICNEQSHSCCIPVLDLQNY